MPKASIRCWLCGVRGHTSKPAMEATGNKTLLLAVAPSFKWPRVRTQIPGQKMSAAQSKKRYVCPKCVVLHARKEVDVCKKDGGGFYSMLPALAFIELFYDEPAWVRDAEKQAKRKHRRPSKARPDGWFTDPAPGKRPHVYRRQFGSACGIVPWNPKMKKGKLGRTGCKLCDRMLVFHEFKT